MCHKVAPSYVTLGPGSSLTPENLNMEGRSHQIVELGSFTQIDVHRMSGWDVAV